MHYILGGSRADRVGERFRAEVDTNVAGLV